MARVCKTNKRKEGKEMKRSDDSIIRNARKAGNAAKKAGYSDEQVEQIIMNSIKAQVLWQMTGHDCLRHSYEILYDLEDFEDGYPEWMKPVVRKRG